MRVLLACPNYPPEFLGGTERVVRALARALAALGDEVLVMSGSDAGHQGEDILREEVDGLPVRRIPRLPGEDYGLDLSRERVAALCEQVFDEWQPDVLHVHHWATLSDALLRRARARGIATVATLHDMWVTCARFFRRPPAGIECPTGGGRDACPSCAHLSLPHLDLQALEQGFAGRDQALREELAAAQVLTTPSESCRRLIREHLPTDREIEVVPHGLLEEVPAAERGAAPVPDAFAKLRVGTFGNLVEEKGVLHLVWACRDVRGIELHLFGPFLSDEFRQIVESKAEEFGVDLHVHGAYGPEDTHPALQMDLAVFPSLCEETYGLVVEEALARGTPVAVSDRGALSERIGRGGAVFSVEEVGPLHQILQKLAHDRAPLEELRHGIPKDFATIEAAAESYRSLHARAVEALR